MSSPSRFLAGNQLLAALNRHECEDLLPNLKLTHLSKNKILYEAGDMVRHAYFLKGGMVSLLSTTESGATVEVAMVGNEGMIGVPIILRTNVSPYRIMVQIPGDVMRIQADVLREKFNWGGQLQDLMLRYTHTLLTQINQSAVCNRFHTLDQRLCRWLLISRDRVKSDVLPLTQEFLSHMLGSPRTAVTMVAGQLQKARLIRYSRGRIRLLDPEGLESASCECYRIVRDEIRHFLAA